MSKPLKLLVVIGYSAVAIQLLLAFLTTSNVEKIYLKYIFKTPNTIRRMSRELKKYPTNATVIDLEFKPPVKLKNDLKFILKYTQAFAHYSEAFRNGQEAFIHANCTYYNCYFTNDRWLLLDIRNFDAILFDVENNWDDHPLLRSLHQKYIFTATESSDNYPICAEIFDNYYNWSWTYKLDSDLRLKYLNIVDNNGTIVGPEINMSWVEPMKPVSKEIRKKLAKKTKAVAWFVSNCYAKNSRGNVTKRLQLSLSRYGMKVDIYGYCGELTCPRDRQEDCLDLLERDYFFYLAFENSLAEDYVTEKLLHPLRHYAVPVVYGGADYSRFLPPNSYINAREMSSQAMAKLMVESIYNRDLYAKYFDWHNHYKYEEPPEVADICNLCRMLNEKPEESVVKQLRVWWNKDYEKECEEEKGGGIHRVKV